MLNWIESRDDVLAATVSGKITGADLEGLMDRLDVMMARHARVHLFIEAKGIDAIDVSAMPSYVARAWPLFAQLQRFDRVAVVADQAWVRGGTRLESALLPSIRYRVFGPEGRETALAWVEGKPEA